MFNELVHAGQLMSQFVDEYRFLRICPVLDWIEEGEQPAFDSETTKLSFQLKGCSKDPRVLEFDLQTIDWLCVSLPADIEKNFMPLMVEWKSSVSTSLKESENLMYLWVTFLKFYIPQAILGMEYFVTNIFSLNMIFG